MTSRKDKYSIKDLKDCEYTYNSPEFFQNFDDTEHKEFIYKIINNRENEIIYYYELTEGGLLDENIRYIIQFFDNYAKAYRVTHFENQEKKEELYIKGETFSDLKNLKSGLPNKSINRECLNFSGGIGSFLGYIIDDKYYSFYEFSTFPSSNYYKSIDDDLNKPGVEAIRLSVIIISLFE